MKENKASNDEEARHTSRCMRGANSRLRIVGEKRRGCDLRKQ